MYWFKKKKEKEKTSLDFTQSDQKGLSETAIL